MGLFFATHIFCYILALVMMIGILFISGWAEKANRPSEKYTCIIVVGLRAFSFLFLVPLGLFFWDMIVKELFVGVFGYGNVMHWLGGLIVIGIIGTEFIMAAAFVAPTRKGLITLIVMIVVFVYFVEIYIPNGGQFTERASVLYVILYVAAAGFICQVSLATFHGIMLRVRHSEKRDTPFWDISKPFKRVFSLKMNILLWALVLVEFMLSFEGFGLLSYISIDMFLGLLAGAAGGIVVFSRVKFLRFRKNLLIDEWNGKHFSRTDKLVRSEEKLVMPDGVELQGFIYKSMLSPGEKESREKEPGPAILFLHGFGGFAQDINFEPMLASFAMAGYTIFAYDYRWSGHSKEKGQNGPIQGVMEEGTRLFEHMVDDAKTALEWMLSHKDVVDPARVAAVGFSMGGLIALSRSIYNDPRVKVIVAGCALHDLGENMDKRIMHGPWWLRFFAGYMAMKMKRKLKMTRQEFLARATALSPAATMTAAPRDLPPSNQRVFLAHTKNDSFVDFQLNFVKNKEMLGLPDANCLVFETGDHPFKNDELVLGSWVFYQLHHHL
nr:alpha/beta hydrolase [Candidatus Sigynarchaeota archaeon]